MSEHTEPEAEPTEQAEPTGQAEPKDERPDKTVRNLAMACHLVALVGLLGNGIGFFLAPLVLWLIKREDHPFIDEQGKEAVNFQITMCIAMFVSVLLVFVVIGFVLLPLVVIADVVLAIMASLKAADGEHYRYPFAIRFIR